MANDREDDGADPEPGEGGGRHQIEGVDHQAKVRELLDSIRPEMKDVMASVSRAEHAADDDGADPDPAADKGADRVQLGSPEGDRKATGGSTEGDAEAQKRATGGQEEGDQPAAEMSAKEKADQYFKRRREKAKEQQGEVELRGTVQDLQRRIDELTRAPARQAEPAAEPKATAPDKNPFNKDDDPVAHFEWELAKTNEELARVREKNAAAEAAIQQEKQQAEEAARQQEIVDNYAKHVDSFLNPAIEEIPGFGKMIDRVVEGLAWTALAQGAKNEQDAVRQATMTLMVIGQKAEQANPKDPDAIANAIFDYCEKVTGGVHLFQEEPQVRTGNGQAQPDLAGARAAAKRRAPGSINSKPGGRPGASPNSVAGLTTLRDREMTQVQAKSIFAMMRQDAGIGR